MSHEQRSGTAFTAEDFAAIGPAEVWAKTQGQCHVIIAALRIAKRIMQPGWMEEQCPYFRATEEVRDTIAAIRAALTSETDDG